MLPSRVFEGIWPSYSGILIINIKLIFDFLKTFFDGVIVSVWFHLCSHLPWFLLLPGLSLDWRRIFELTLWRTFIEGIQWNHMCRVSGVVEISSFSSLFPLWMRVAKVRVLGYCSPTSILGKIFWDLGMVEVRGWGGVLPRAQVCIPAFLSWNQLFSDCPIPEITWGTFYKFNSLPPPSSRDRVRLHGSVRTCSLAEIKCKSQIHSPPPAVNCYAPNAHSAFLGWQEGSGFLSRDET